MFAFALWDHERRTLLVARDRLGIKALLYAWMPGRGLALASEAKALRPLLADTAVDPLALRQVLLFGYAASPRSLLRGVRKLPPAQAFLVKPGEEPRPFTYWQPHFGPPLTGKPADLRAELRDRLTRAVRRQLVSDVPVGAFLSGGLDSSIVVSLMTREFPERVNTFSVGGRGFAASELPYAKLMAERLGVRHHPIEVDRRQFLQALPDVAWHNDEPTADPALVPLYFLSKLARQHVTVALCGEGADEVFAGYGHYPSARKRMRRLQFVAALPVPLRQAGLGAVALLRGRERARQLGTTLAALDRDPFAAVLRRPERLEQHLTALLGDDAAVADARADYRASLDGAALESNDPLEPSLRADLRCNLADFLLVRADNMAMAAGLEARVPFLDEGIVEFATRLPGAAKLDGQRGKAILRDVFGDLLPPEILARPKAPFPVPVAEWVLGDARLLRDTLLHGGALVNAGLLQRVAVERFLETARLQPAAADGWDCTLAWRLFYLEVWARRFIRDERLSLG
jgi:asparagine synthase (glutamine-hydrolysing)